jgi:hypothetical protein
MLFLLTFRAMVVLEASGIPIAVVERRRIMGKKKEEEGFKAVIN